MAACCRAKISVGAMTAVGNAVATGVAIGTMVNAIRSGDYTVGEIAGYGGQVVLHLIGLLHLVLHRIDL